MHRHWRRLSGLLVAIIAMSSLVSTLGSATSKTQAAYTGKLPLPRVSANGRYLVNPDGTPFIWIGDTAWKAFYRLSRENADYYLQDRANKGFTVVQMVSTPVYENISTPNVYGQTTMVNGNPLQPNEAFFQHVDYIVNKAEELGLYVAFLPSWGNSHVRYGPLNSEASSRAWGRFLGQRYANKPVIWVLGGDTFADGALGGYYRAMAQGIREHSTEQLITFHPMPGVSSAHWFDGDSWLSFNMMQTGHYLNSGVSAGTPYITTEKEYTIRSVRPLMDGEPDYENIDLGAWQMPGQRLSTHESRSSIYWTLFAGGFGVNFGNNDVWQFYGATSSGSDFGGNTNWKEALNWPGSVQMRYVRNLLESRPFLTRAPDQGVLASSAGTGGDHIRATRSSDGSYAFVYTPAGKSFSVNLSKISGDTVQAYWFNPRTGAATNLGTTANTKSTRTYTPPTSGAADNDWVLVLDDAARGFASPGTQVASQQPPVVSAGADQRVTLPNTAALSGTATDDGLPNPPAQLTVMWSKMSGPGTVTFANASVTATTATFSLAGTYTLRLTAQDGEFTNFDDVSVTVDAEAVPPPQKTTVTLTTTVDKETAVVGDTLTYTVTYKNTGAVNARHVLLTSPIPAGTSYVENSAIPVAQLANGVIKWSADLLGPGESKSVSFQVTVEEPVPPPSGPVPVANWSMDESSGTTATDSSGNSHSAAMHAITFGAGEDSGSFKFDGQSSYLQAPDHSDFRFSGKPFTVSAWVKSSSNTSQLIVEKQHSDWYGEFLFAINRDGATDGRYSVWTGNQWIDSWTGGTTKVTDGQWHLLTVTYDGTTFRLYRDGQLDRVQAATSAYASSAYPLTIGKFAVKNVGWYFNGLMDSVRIYPTELSAQDIQTLYTSGRGN